MKFTKKITTDAILKTSLDEIVVKIDMESNIYNKMQLHEHIATCQCVVHGPVRSVLSVSLNDEICFETLTDQNTKKYQGIVKSLTALVTKYSSFGHRYQIELHF